MNANQNKSRGFWHGFIALGVGLVVALPLSTARADDDDDWEDYYDQREEEREDARERWEDWHEDREEALEDWRERHGRHRYYAPRHEYRTYRYGAPGYYGYQPGPVYERYYGEEPRYYRYEPPRYRYYGTPDVGYSEFGRQRSIQLGPVRVFWDR